MYLIKSLWNVILSLTKHKFGTFAFINTYIHDNLSYAAPHTVSSTCQLKYPLPACQFLFCVSGRGLSVCHVTTEHSDWLSARLIRQCATGLRRVNIVSALGCAFYFLYYYNYSLQRLDLLCATFVLLSHTHIGYYLFIHIILSHLYWKWYACLCQLRCLIITIMPSSGEFS